MFLFRVRNVVRQGTGEGMLGVRVCVCVAHGCVGEAVAPRRLGAIMLGMIPISN